MVLEAKECRKDPFRNLRRVDTVGRAESNIRLLVERQAENLVAASAVQLDVLEIGGLFPGGECLPCVQDSGLLPDAVWDILGQRLIVLACGVDVDFGARDLGFQGIDPALCRDERNNDQQTVRACHG